MNALAAVAIAVSADAIQLDLEAADAASAIRAVGAPLVAAGLVTGGYVDAAVAREAIYPTGLPTVPEAIAVPHADPEGVIAPAIALGRLRAPVSFVEMATADRALAVRLVVLLALHSKDEAAVLSKLVRGLQDGALLPFLLSTTSRDAVAERLNVLLTPESAPPEAAGVPV